MAQRVYPLNGKNEIKMKSFAFICLTYQIFRFYSNRFFNGVKINRTGRFKIQSKEKVFTLTISKPTVADNGVYSCEGETSAGTANSWLSGDDFRLQIPGKK